MISKQPKDDMKAQLKELATNDTLIALLPNLNKLTVIPLSISVSTESVERLFCHMRSRIDETEPINLMIAIESPDTLSESDIEEIVYGIRKTCFLM